MGNKDDDFINWNIAISNFVGIDRMTTLLILLIGELFGKGKYLFEDQEKFELGFHDCNVKVVH